MNPPAPSDPFQKELSSRVSSSKLIESKTTSFLLQANKIEESAIKTIDFKKRDYAILHTARSIIRNICEGLIEGYTIKMKVVFAHFPITVKVEGKNIIIENFQGERAPRRTVIVGNTKVIPKGEDVILTGEVWTDITQTAANIELKTKVKNKDHRVFLDGIYVFEKKKGIEK